MARCLWLAALAIALCGCFVDRGQTFVADNRTDHEFVARITGKVPTAVSSGLTGAWRQDLALLPRQSRVAFESLGFTSDFSIWTIEFLDPDCAVVARFDQGNDLSFSQAGTLFVIDSGPNVTLRQEWPASGDAAAPTNRCSKLPNRSLLSSR